MGIFCQQNLFQITIIFGLNYGSGISIDQLFSPFLQLNPKLFSTMLSDLFKAHIS